MLVGSILGKYPTKACFKPANRDGKDGDFAIFDCQIRKNQHKRPITNEIYFENTVAYKKIWGNWRYKRKSHISRQIHAPITRLYSVIPSRTGSQVRETGVTTNGGVGT
jgi:hypothetical protein